MSNHQSIEDLFSDDSNGAAGKETVQAKFKDKQQEVKIKEIERATKKKADSLGMAYINLVGFPISPEALALITEEEARGLSVVCFYYDGRQLRLAATRPDNPQVLSLAKELAAKYFCQEEVYLTSEYSLNYALNIYKSIPRPRLMEKGVKITEADLNKYSESFASFKDLQEQIGQIPVTEVVTMMMAAAVKTNSSDIHIEAEEKEIKVRFRIDGVLHDVASLDKSVWQKIISRMKLLAGVKINIIDKPQDGRLSIYLTNDRIDIRVSFLPTNFGESVVMRLLRSSAVGLEFDDLGIRGRAFQQLKREIERPNGMIITTGPTGSGKTTTLYAILKKLNQPEIKIITIEDPIE